MSEERKVDVQSRNEYGIGRDANGFYHCPVCNCWTNTIRHLTLEHPKQAKVIRAACLPEKQP